MISIIDPDVVSHVLRPTVYRAADAPVEASHGPRDPQKNSVELNRLEMPDADSRQLAART